MADAAGPRPRRAAVLVGGFFLLCGILAAGLGLHAAASELRFSWRAETVEGRVEQVRTEWRQRSRRRVADLHFVTREGREVRIPALRPNSRMRHAAGDTVPVRYDPADPARATLEPLSLRLIGSLIALPFAAAFGAFGWMLAAGRPRWPLGVFVGSGAALALLLAALLAANEVEEALADRRATALAEGEVVGHRRMARGAAGAETLHAPLIRLTTEDGRTVIAEPPLWSRVPAPARGSLVTLRYRRDAPERAAPDRPVLGWLRPAAALALPFLLAAGGLALLLRRRRRRAPPRRA